MFLYLISLNRLPSEQLAKETEEYESMQESPVSHTDTRSVELVRLNEESGNDDSRFSADDCLDQETSQSLVPHSQNMDLDSSNVETSQSIIPHSEESGSRLNKILHMKGDEVEVCLRREKTGHLITSVGRVKYVDPDRPNWVRLYGRKNYRRVLQNFTRHWTSMISNDTQSSSEYSISQSY